MSNDTDFLARWSRRKHHAATDKIRQSKSESTPDDIVSGTSAALAQGENRLPFDPASLPTIESIGAEFNIRAFLEAGVPGDLARAALRRVWSLDPAIRDFVGLSENSWDFNAPGAMAGLRTNRRGGGRAAFDAAVRRTGHNSRCGASACHIAAGRRLSEASRRIRSGRESSNQRGIGGAGICQRSAVGLR